MAASEQVWFIVLLQAAMIKHSAASELQTAPGTLSACLSDLFVFLSHPFLQLSPLLNKQSHFSLSVPVLLHTYPNV